jgi:hypothetical protein
MTIRAALGIAALLASLACGGRSTAELPGPMSRTVVRVINHNTLDMHVYAITGSQMQSLGVVSSLSQAAYELPAHAVATGDVRIFADPIGARTGYITDRIVFSPGDQVEVTIENNLALSNYVVR